MRHQYFITRLINPAMPQRIRWTWALALFALFLNDAIAQSVSTTINTAGPGTFIVPAGVTSLQIQAWGGGGAGGGAQGTATLNRSGGGGSGGAYTAATVAVTPGASYTYTVGAGGTGVSNAIGNPGGASTFNSPVVVTAAGGNPGMNNNGAGGAASIGGTFNGGAGAAGTSGASGGGGGSAGSAGNGGNALTTTGGAAGAGIGGAGANGVTLGANGIAATQLGGGGGGARSTSNFFGATPRPGGAGFRGQIIITYTLPTLVSFPATGCLNSTITLTGTNFIAPLTVTFNGVPATFVNIISANQIDVVVPSNATTGNIRVTTATGYTTNAGIFTVNGANLSGPASICMGDSALYTASSAGTWASSNPGVASIDPNTGAVTTITSGSVIFTFTDTSSGCATSTASVSIHESPTIITHPAPQSVCSAGSATFSVAATGSGLTYQWFRGATQLNNGGSISGATSNTLTISPVALGDAAPNYYCVVSGFCTPQAISNNAALTVTERVVITAQPVASQTLCTGQTANFSVSATGAGLTYQWYNGATALANGGNISGANSPTLSIANLATSDASALYHCEVFGTGPCSSVISGNSILVVNQGPSIIGQPPVLQTVCAGDAAVFSISAIGGNLNYQWYKGATPMVDGGSVNGATTATLIINPTVPGDTATNYRCVVSNGCATPATSNNAGLAVNERPFIYAYSTATCSGIPFAVGPTTGVPGATTIVPSGTTYSWATPVVTGGMTGGSAASNETGITQTLHNPTILPQTATYTVIPTSGTTGNCVGPSFVVTVTVNPVPSLSNIAASVCSGQNLVITPANGGGNLIPAGTTYSWGIPAMTPGLTGGAAGTNQVSLSFTLTNTSNAVQTAIYTVTPFSGGCAGNTFDVTVTVNPTPTLGISLATQGICSGTAITPIVLTNPNGVPGTTTYIWNRSNTNITGLASGGGSPISGVLTNTTGIQQTATFTIIAVSEEGCQSVAGTATVTVDPTPTVTPIANQIVCSGNAITTVNITSNVSGATFTWTRTDNPNLSGMPLSGSGSSIAGTLTSISNINETTTFTITPTSGSCSNAAGIATFTVTVRPRPMITATPLTQTVCGGQPFVITSFDSNNVSGTVYSFTKSNNVTGDNVSLSGGTLSGTLENNTLSPRTVTFVITATANGCAVNTSVDVVVSPNPAFTLTPMTQNICSGGAISTINFPAVAGVTYSWTRTNPIASGNLSGLPDSDVNATSISGTLTNLTATVQTTVITVTATIGGCSKVVNVTLNVFAEMGTSVGISASQAVCAGSAPAALFISTPPSGGSGSYTYQWQRSTISPTGPWTNVGTGSTYQPPVTGGGSPDTYYQLVVNGCQTATSNVVTIETISGLNNTFTVNDGIPTGSNVICSGSTFSPMIESNSSLLNYSTYTWNVDPAHFSPATGGPVGTQHYELFGLLVYTDATIGPITAINNTNASVIVPFTITPTVFVRFIDAQLCSLTPRTFNVTIRPRPVAIPSEVSNICNISPTGIVISGNITDASMSFTWQRVDSNANLSSTILSGASGTIAAGGNFNIPDVLTNSSLLPQTATYQVTPASLGCTGTPILVNVTVNPFLPGTISGNQTVCNPGDPVAFTETAPAGGTSYTYQWQSSTTSAAGPYANITLNGNNATYDPPAGLTQTTWYRRIVSSIVGGSPCSVATTTPVLVTVNSVVPGTISGAQTICSGGSATLTGTTSTGSGSISYQWQSNTTGCGGTWTTISGTSANLTVSGLTQTTYFRRVAISTVGGYPCSDYSNCIAITVNTITPGTIGSDETVCGNNPSAFTVITPAVGAGNVTYQWQSNTTGCGGTWTNVASAFGDVYDPPAGLLVTTYYRRIAISTLNGVSCSAAGNCITVTANAVAAGSIGPVSGQVVCIGGDPVPLTSTAPGTGTGISYQWQSSPSALPGTWTDIAGASGLTYDPPGPLNTSIYFRRLTIATLNSTACNAPSNAVFVQVNFVTPATVTGDQTLCSNLDPGPFAMSVAATGSQPVTYQWQSSTTDCSNGFTNIIGATVPAYNPPAVTQTTYFRLMSTSNLNGTLCSAFSNCITVTVNGKVWRGIVSTDWNNPANWQPAGVPSAAHCVVVPNVINKPEVLGAGFDAYAHSVTIQAGANLDILSGNSITVTDIVNVMPTGGFSIENNASLVQINNVANTGNINMFRTTQPMYRYDYTYWGSPVTLASGFTLNMLSPNTLFDKYFYWNPTNAGGAGNWVGTSSATVMNPNRGYIVRAPQSFSTNPAATQPYTANFIGVPNNGDINIPIAIGTMAPGLFNDKLNLIGNPYPSGVDADAFLSHPTNAGLIDGTIYFWTHHSPPSAAYPNPFYGNYTYNYTAGDYATYTLLGGLGTAPTGYGGPVPNGYIAAGQGFFVKGLANGNAIFTNAMRDKDNNSDFFRMSTLQKQRVWLNLANTQGGFSQTMVGYAENATLDYDRGLDASAFGGNFVSFYSLLEDQQMVSIQGRPWPFVSTDQVPMGYNATVANNYTIGIDHVDTAFDTQNIYIEDKLLNIIHDLKAAPYVFASEAGRFNDRFVLRYTDGLLGVDRPDGTVAGCVAFIDRQTLNIQASDAIKTVEIFDLTGKSIRNFEPENSSRSFTAPFVQAQGVYLAKIKLENGAVVTAKLMNNQ